ncbi:broad-spectrum mercury transporter MerE [Paraburkholderia sp. CNPSo 3157]|uniref:Broad-spectrum mercury transporter MerE n=1 Tax=Paraburkholderia franconis TaxID=2654983 RepID=A0A7X1TLC2_9BURK|nr:broad-spectrum mercury transporter MerE [Paraburkholderia franconis]MPW23622.1 broad-spectrum mercury transporter MerE [Paraburkholderia franconis]
MSNSSSPGVTHDSRWRAYVWGALAALTCPCHLPVLLVVLSGTAAGAFVNAHWGVAALALLALFFVFLTRALQAFRRLHRLPRS